ncbi:hypothetical protein [Pseudomonas caspiana]|uniref:Uncharacterized protein n=1 Tax=Pseudomonas caspiana TaxID=1451454 RepID=A0A1Y3P1M5_9PSED|nr:hypothetical protein [Pseudomonas caspiana]OUM73725.1 hypothetical protein AUC60_11660 [Pseudomonas caspiana]
MAKKNCAYCNKEFHTRPQGQHAKFCSDACRKASHKAEKQNETTLTLQFGKVTLKIVDLDPTIDKESLRRTIIDTLGPELITHVSALEPSRQVTPDHGKLFPSVILFEDGWTQQANLTLQQIISLPGTQRLVGENLRTVKEVR